MARWKKMEPRFPGRADLSQNYNPSAGLSGIRAVWVLYGPFYESTDKFECFKAFLKLLRATLCHIPTLWHGIPPIATLVAQFNILKFSNSVSVMNLYFCVQALEYNYFSKFRCRLRIELSLFPFLDWIRVYFKVFRSAKSFQVAKSSWKEIPF